MIVFAKLSISVAGSVITGGGNARRLPFGPLGCPIDKGIDRLATHGPQTTFRPPFSQPEIAPVPPLREAVDNEDPEGAIAFDQRFTPPAQLIGSAA